MMYQLFVEHFMLNILVNASYPELIRSLRMLCPKLVAIPIHYEILSRKTSCKAKR